MKQILYTSLVLLLAAFIFNGCRNKKSVADDVLRDSTFTSLSQPEWTRNAVIYEVNWRQFTDKGDIEGVTRQLGRLKELGVDILWLMPVNPISEVDRKGSLGSYYAVKDYTALNPELGTMDQFKDFVQKAHDMGMKIIIDWVPNHSGRDNAWVTEHPDWYARNEEGEMFGPYDWTDVYKFDYSVPDMRRAMIDAMKFWITEVDVDGFRCDVAGAVPTDFWESARTELDAARPEGVFMLAEDSKPELNKHAFNMSYNWPMKDVFNAIAQTAGYNTHTPADGSPERDYGIAYASAIDSLLAIQAVEFPRDSYLMNMITNHDLNSWEGTEFERLGDLNKAFAVLSWTLPGMPLIYTGQETGMNRPFEFFEKDNPPQWEPRNEYFQFYQKLNHLKHTQEALRAGEEGGEIISLPATSPSIYAFERKKGNSDVIVITNLGNETVPVELEGAPSLEDSQWIDFFEAVEGAYPETLAPGEYTILIKRPSK